MENSHLFHLLIFCKLNTHLLLDVILIQQSCRNLVENQRDLNLNKFIFNENKLIQNCKTRKYFINMNHTSNLLQKFLIKLTSQIYNCH